MTSPNSGSGGFPLLAEAQVPLHQRLDRRVDLLELGFSEEQIITTLADGAADVFAADLDGDGDLDVLSASSIGDEIAWYANDSQGGFSQKKVISHR